MSKLNSRLMLAAVLATALVAGCGGQNNDSGGASGGTSAGGTDDTGGSVTKTLAFIVALIAGNSENSDPVDINPITLAVDDTIDPIPL